MKSLHKTGGARLGWWSASWPLGKLVVTHDRLEVSAAIGGRYVFAPGDIQRLVPAGVLFGGGVRIVHRVEAYSRRVEFYTFGSSAALIAEMEATGFFATPPPLPGARSAAAVDRSETSILPFRWPFVVLAVGGWNAALAPVMYQWFTEPLGDLAQEETFAIWAQGRYAVLFAISMCLGVLFVGPFRDWALHEGWTRNDILAPLIFVLSILLIFLIAMSAG